jgi:1-acyl-sn-glycerol-3-phosphate acyltransferase
MSYVKSLLSNIWIYGFIAFGVVFASVFGWFLPQRFHMYWWNHLILPKVLWGMKVFGGLDVEFRGLENLNNNAIYACKHQSAWETYVLTTVLDKATMILKKELMYIPFFGWAAKLYGLISVDRSAGASAMKKMLESAKAMVKTGRPIVIFPEGHRVPAGTSLKYKPGFLFLAQNLNMPVVPVALNSGMFWPRSSFKHISGKIVVEFLPAMTMQGDKNEFIQKVQDCIEKKCYELNQEAMKNFPACSVNYFEEL